MKRFIVLVVAIICILIMNVIWFKVVEDEKVYNQDLIANNEDLQISLENISLEMETLKKEYTELVQDLEASEYIGAELKLELDDIEKLLSVQDLELKRLEMLARDVNLMLPTINEYKTMELYHLTGDIRSMPYDDSSLLTAEKSIGFILGSFTNNNNEEWIYVETLATKDPNKRYGFIQTKDLGEKIYAKESDIFYDIEINGIRIGDNIYDLLVNYNHNMVLEIEDEYWTVILDEVSVLIHPEHWTVLGVLTRNEDVMILNDIHVGGSLTKAIEIMALEYTNLFESNSDEISMNWFYLGDGNAISFDYTDSEVTDSTIITEITMIKIEYVD